VAKINGSQTLLYIIVGFVIFITLIFFNYFKVQKNLADTKSSPRSLDLVSYPEKIKLDSTGTFIWTVNTSPDLATSYTSIYWGYESSPSALQKTDSPSAVNYPYTQIDYGSGVFQLPNTFDVNIKFGKIGRVWFRGYAKINDDHLWSEEKFLDVEE